MLYEYTYSIICSQVYMIFDINYIDLASDLLKNWTSFVISETNVYVSAKLIIFFRDDFECI
jgi:hypothetical protein